MNAKARHRIELMVIFLVITALANILVYYLNHTYESRNVNALAKSEEIIKHPTPTRTPTETPIPCHPFTAPSKAYSLCYPDGWKLVQQSADTISFFPDTIDPTEISFSYLSFRETTLPSSPLPPPQSSFSAYEQVKLGTTSAFISQYVPNKNNVPFTGGCADPLMYLVSVKKSLLYITTCVQHKTKVLPILNSLVLTE